jgi:hypothetical protein
LLTTAQNGDRAKFGTFLVDECGCHGPSVNKEGSGTIAAVVEKCGSFVLPEADPGSAAPAETPAGTSKVMAAFISKMLSYQDTCPGQPGGG